MYIIWYGVGRFMIESLRTDSLYLGTMRVSQLVAVLSVLGGIVLKATGVLIGSGGLVFLTYFFSFCWE